jgi:L-fucose isomerase-like protein
MRGAVQEKPRPRDRIDGVIVTLPNFGEERGIVDALKLAGLDVPVLVHAWQDDPAKMTIKHRRDSFCGKMSACNNLMQYGIPFSLTKRHTMAPETPEFDGEIHWFAAVCRVVRGLRNCRIGAIGARPTAFNTVRYSEKLLEKSGISVVTLDLSEVFGKAARIADDDPKVKERIAAIQGYTKTGGVPPHALVKMAKLGSIIDDWMKANELDVTAIQCWTSMEEFYGVVPCTVMSMLSEGLKSSACETDVAGTVSMHALALASLPGAPASSSTGTTTTATTPTSASASTARTCPRAPSNPPRWSTRRSSPAPSARRTPTARSTDASSPDP